MVGDVDVFGSGMIDGVLCKRYRCLIVFVNDDGEYLLPLFCEVNVSDFVDEGIEPNSFSTG